MTGEVTVLRTGWQPREEKGQTGWFETSRGRKGKSSSEEGRGEGRLPSTRLIVSSNVNGKYLDRLRAIEP